MKTKDNPTPTENEPKIVVEDGRPEEAKVLEWADLVDIHTTFDQDCVDCD